MENIEFDLSQKVTGQLPNDTLGCTMRVTTNDSDPSRSFNDITMYDLKGEYLYIKHANGSARIRNTSIKSIDLNTNSRYTRLIDYCMYLYYRNLGESLYYDVVAHRRAGKTTTARKMAETYLESGETVTVMVGCSEQKKDYSDLQEKYESRLTVFVPKIDLRSKQTQDPARTFYMIPEGIKVLILDDIQEHLDWSSPSDTVWNFSTDPEGNFKRYCSKDCQKISWNIYKSQLDKVTIDRIREQQNDRTFKAEYELKWH